MMWWLAAWAWAAPEVVVLGIAQDAGHPQADCRKECCRAAFDDPAAGHRVASLGIVDGDRAWLVDATPDLPLQLHDLLGTERQLAGVLLTHGHMGHYTGLIHLGREAMGADHVPVYAMPRMAGMLLGSEPWALLTRLGHVDVQRVSAGEPVVLSESVRATPFEVPHRDELSETVGWRIEGPSQTVVWLPDIDQWEKWSTPLEEMLAEVDVAYLDATFYNDGEIVRDMSEVPHPFVVETIARLAHHPELRAKVRFVHLNHTNPLLQPGDPSRAAVEAAGLAVAEEGERQPL